MKNSAAAEYFHTDGQTEMMSLTVAFCNFGKAPKISVLLPVCMQVNTQKQLNRFVGNLMLDNFTKPCLAYCNLNSANTSHYDLYTITFLLPYACEISPIFNHRAICLGRGKATHLD
jgi:hypothetical protein